MAESGQTAAKPEVIIKTDEKIDIEKNHAIIYEEMKVVMKTIKSVLHSEYLFEEYDSFSKLLFEKNSLEDIT